MIISWIHFKVMTTSYDISLAMSYENEKARMTPKFKKQCQDCIVTCNDREDWGRKEVEPYYKILVVYCLSLRSPEWIDNIKEGTKAGVWSGSLNEDRGRGKVKDPIHYQIGHLEKAPVPWSWQIPWNATEEALSGGRKYWAYPHWLPAPLSCSFLCFWKGRHECRVGYHGSLVLLNQKKLWGRKPSLL